MFHLTLNSQFHFQLNDLHKVAHLFNSFNTCKNLLNLNYFNQNHNCSDFKRINMFK